MKHFIIGGDGFVGRHLAADLVAAGEEVVVADIVRSGHDVYKSVRFIGIDVTKPDSFRALPLGADDVVYNLSARMLSPIQRRSRRHEFFFPVNTDGTKNILEWMKANGARRLVHFTTDMVYGHAKFTPQTEDHPTEPLGEYGLSKLVSEKLLPRFSHARVLDIGVPASPDHWAGAVGHSCETFLVGRRGTAHSDDRFGRQSLPVHFGVRLRSRRLSGMEGRLSGTMNSISAPTIRHPCVTC